MAKSLTKFVGQALLGFYDDIRVIPGLFSIVHSENRGVALGVFNDSDSQWRNALLVALSIAAVFVGQALLGCRRAFARRPSHTTLARKPRSAYPPREAAHAN
ncbi:MAG: signal peptidase II [Bryobacteraceae bacterium]